MSNRVLIGLGSSLHVIVGLRLSFSAFPWKIWNCIIMELHAQVCHISITQNYINSTAFSFNVIRLEENSLVINLLSYFN